MNAKTISGLPVELLKDSISYTNEKNGFEDLFISGRYCPELLHWFKSVNVEIVSVSVWEFYLDEFLLVGAWNIKLNENYNDAKLYLDSIKNLLTVDKVYVTFEIEGKKPKLVI